MKYIQLQQAPAEGAGVHRTSIEWCDYALGGLVRAKSPKTGKAMNLCVKVSEGCRNCYAETISKRFHGVSYSAQAAKDAEWFFDEGAARSMLNFRPKGPYKNGRTRPAVFADDMTDPFGEWVSDEWLDRRFALMALRPDVDWLVLTKRPERAAEYLDGNGVGAGLGVRIACHARDMVGRSRGDQLVSRTEEAVRLFDAYGGILPNVWLGTSIEDQASADKRIPALAECPAAVRFLSVEPLLGPVDLKPWLGAAKASLDAAVAEIQHALRANARGSGVLRLADPPINWVIVGGESGRGARPCKVAWIQSIVRQCREAGVPCFVKQLGSNPQGDPPVPPVRDEATGTTTYTVQQVFEVNDPKGGDPAEWPAPLRVRQMPGGQP